ncbi:MAG: LysM peptidoglycan-binding domain-containing protein [Luteolibacter sp.]
MNSFRLLTASTLTLALASCASQKSDTYDTTNPYGVADAGAANLPATAPENPVYDTPAAYEESSATSPTAASVNLPATPSSPNIPAASAPRPTSNGAATIHTVVAGDTLSGLSAKYKVPSAAIKQANNMTKDTVVLGRKMVIPPAQ